MSEAELHTLTGAYAVDALPEGERAEFERHLARCPACAQEVRELTATAERLALSVAATPPPEMRDRLLRQITTVRQEPPRLLDVPREHAGGGTGLSRALPRWALAACLAAAAALGGVAVWQHQAAQHARQQAEQSQRDSARLAGVLAAPDAKTVDSRALPGGAKGTVVVSRSQNRAAFLASGLHRPPGGKVYQLWFADGGRLRSAGLVDSGRSDGGSGGAGRTGDAVLMEGPVDKASAMGITVEPAGGSKQPTSKPLALMKLPRA